MTAERFILRPLIVSNETSIVKEWKTILEKAWQAGIPHVIFTGGEPTLRPDLPELIQKAEELGQVTGLITDGVRLTEKDYLHQLLNAGLDHIMLTLAPEESTPWEALRDAIGEDIFVSVHVTLTDKNLVKLDETLDRLTKIGVRSLSISASNDATVQALPSLQRKCAEMGFSLVWDLPVPYSANNPINLELENAAEKLEGSGKTWLYVEPDGDVLPGQGINRVLGNILNDPWESIWLNASKE
jgi:MoaA/NifB/PqqE/SkfB family radical SAM enzyme